MIGIGRGTIFRPDKGLRVASRPMVGLGVKDLTTVPEKRVNVLRFLEPKGRTSLIE